LRGFLLPVETEGDTIMNNFDIKNVEIKFTGAGEYGIHDGFFNAIAVIDGEEYDFQCCANIVISKSKWKAWATKSGEYKEGFREMPLSALKAFIDELYIRKLVKIDD